MSAAVLLVRIDSACNVNSHSLGPVQLGSARLGSARPAVEPEPTQHSKPTFVWVYIAGTCGYI